MASNPAPSAKESLTSLFDENRRKVGWSNSFSYDLFKTRLF